MSAVLDASAVLAYLHREPGWVLVQGVVEGSAISAVNWSQVAQKTLQKGLSVATARELLAPIGLQIVPFVTAQPETAAALWERGRPLWLCLADRACLALAIERQAPVLTSDCAWSDLDLGVEIRLVR